MVNISAELREELGMTKIPMPTGTPTTVAWQAIKRDESKYNAYLTAKKIDEDILEWMLEEAREDNNVSL